MPSEHVPGETWQASGGLVQSGSWQHSLPSTQVEPPQQVWPALQQPVPHVTPDEHEPGHVSTVSQPLFVWHDQQLPLPVQPPVPSWQVPAGTIPHAPAPLKSLAMNVAL